MGGGNADQATGAAVSRSVWLAADAFPCGRRSNLGNALPFLTEADCLREFRTNLGIARCDHGIIGRETPLLAVLGRSQAPAGEMTLERFIRLAVLQTDQEVRRD